MHYISTLMKSVLHTVNRSHSFISINNKDDGLLPGQHSPNLDITCLHHCDHMIQQQSLPLASYSYKLKMADHHNINCARNLQAATREICYRCIF